MSDAQPRALKVRCKCGAVLKISEKAAGKKAKCPKCENVFVVPRPKTPAPVEKPLAPEPLAMEPEADSLLNELAGLEEMAEATSKPDASRMKKKCTHCGEGMPAEAKLCVSCGYDEGTGKVRKAVSAKKAARADKVRWLASGAGSFVLGAILSLVGALIGAGIWCGVAIATDYEIGWIAWGLGLLAGGGMAMGYRRENVLGGLTAAGIAAFGIVAAKLMIVIVVIVGQMPDTQREELVEHQTQQVLNEQGLWSEEARAGQLFLAKTEARSRVNQLSDDEVQRRYEEVFELSDGEGNRSEAELEKITKVSEYRAEVKATKLDLSLYDDGRYLLEGWEHEQALELSRAELDDAVAEVEAWEAGERWEDIEYVQHSLALARAEETFVEEWGADEGYLMAAGDKRWKKHFQDATATVGAMSTEDLVGEAKSRKSQQKLQEMRFRVAWHLAERRADELRLPPFDDRWTQTREEAHAKVEQLIEEELDAEIKKIEDWEAGAQWGDAAFVRRLLFNECLDEIVGNRAFTNEEGEPTNSYLYFRNHPEEPDGILKEADAAVDAVPAERHLERLREMEAASERQREQRFAEYEAEQNVEMAKEFGAIFWNAMFSGMDVLFFLLAVGTAFKVGSSGLELDED